MTIWPTDLGNEVDAIWRKSVAGAGSTTTLVNFAGALAAHLQGKMLFAAGADAGVAATVKYVTVGASLTPLYPLPESPAAGDALTVYYGCDHTAPTCQNRFNNLENFRGFPYVPPPQMAV